MGVDAGDFDEDGDDDVFVGELTGQGADLYVNDGSGVFVEGSAQAGIRRAHCRSPRSAPPGSTPTMTDGSTWRSRTAR